MGDRITFSRWIRNYLYFFPLQLLVLHVKKNQLLLLSWLVLFGFVTSALGLKYGVPYIFLFPEYFGTSSFWSFSLFGFALGGYITAYDLYSYTMHAYRFPFLTTLARPYQKFTINNALIPIAFVITYLICSAKLQISKELIPPLDVVLNLSGFLVGVSLFLVLALLYFTRTNTDIHKILGPDAAAHQAPEPMEDILPQRTMAPAKRQDLRRATRWLRREERTKKWKVETYLTSPFRVALARSSAHYDKELLRSVLWQNHINASIFEVALIITFIALGAFGTAGVFAIPAGASVFVLFTMLLMLMSALTSWFKGWTVTVLLGVAIAINLLSLHTESFFYDAQAYGLEYSAEPAHYDRATITALANDTAAAHSDARALEPMLNRWLARNIALPKRDAKPKLLIVNTSGGGSRAMLWTYRCLQVADSLLGGDLMGRTVLMTGSSGGLIGATYYRQLYAAQKHDTLSLTDPTRLSEMASDILNPVAFSFVSNDMFIRYRRVNEGMRSYTLDRGYAFEQRLDLLTHGLLDTRLSDFALAEQRAEIPMLVISPTSINDGRRVVISAQPVAFLTNITPSGPVHNEGQPEAIEFGRLFAAQDARNLKLSSALRMNATFPYITPIVTLPSEPKMRVMDAGVRDNYGYRTTAMFLFTFRDWIARNTGGVVILQMRDKQKELDVKPINNSLFSRLLDPVGSVYGNFVKSQDQDYDLMLKQADAWATFPLYMIDLQLRHEDDDEISLSWHLTAVEKKHVLNTIHSPDNQRAFTQLRDLVIGSSPLVTADAAGGNAQDLEADRVRRR